MLLSLEVQKVCQKTIEKESKPRLYADRVKTEPYRPLGDSICKTSCLNFFTSKFNLQPLNYGLLWKPDTSLNTQLCRNILTHKTNTLASVSPITCL